MKMTNEFFVSLPVSEAWAMLTDVERIAPCLPGARLLETEGDTHHGVVKVKVGPITAEYRGTVRFAELDEAARRVVLQADGRETRGQGNAHATIATQLSPSGEGTYVSVVTDLDIAGKAAQFGRGVLEEVSAKFLDQFVSNLGDLAKPEPEGAAGRPAAAEPAETGAGVNSQRMVTQAPARVEAEPVNLLEFARGPIAKRLAPVGFVVLVAALVVWLLRKFR